jgi:hypothetical protein
VFTLTDQQKFGPAKTLPKFPARVLLLADRRRKPSAQAEIRISPDITEPPSCGVAMIVVGFGSDHVVRFS